MRERDIIMAARVMSMALTPFYLPLFGLIALFTFSYLKLLPWSYKLFVVLIVYFFTILLPTYLIHFYRRYQGWSPLELGMKERRMVPYLLSIGCYFGCYYIMRILQIPSFVGSILIASLSVQVVCAIINIWWKVSTHTAAIGGVAGAIVAFSGIFLFNPVWWLCLILILAGLVGTSRMILRQHTLSQVVGAFFIGFVCAFEAIIHM